MSWDSQVYSFGNQPPTPTKTPTSAQFPDSTYQTPRNNLSSFEERTGWTPTFAEDYSVFNSTPGRLTNNNPTFADIATPRPPTAQPDRRHSNAGDIAAEIASHIHHFSPNPSLPLPPVDPSSQLPSSPGPYLNQFDDTIKHITPRKPRKRLEEAFSGQTATPPATASKGSRKLAPKLSIGGNMQNDSRPGQYGESQTPTHQTGLMDFPSTSADLFGYPMSAPATAPAFSNTKPFWDPEASMGGMDFEYNTSLDMTESFSHKANNSFDWGRSNQIFQDTDNMLPPSSQGQVHNQVQSKAQKDPQKAPSKRPRPIAPKIPQATATQSLVPLQSPDTLWKRRTPFEFDPSPSDGLDIFNINPDLLHNGGIPTSMAHITQSGMQESMLAGSDPPLLQPYAHQRRLAEREREDLEEYPQYTNSRETRAKRYERGTASSPIRGPPRPGLHRSVSESRGRQRRSQERVVSRSGGRTSPTKRPSNLTSIPERAPRLREEVQFVVDHKGRAGVETVLIQDHSSSFLDESSTDEEAIVIPSRETSFNLPTLRKPRVGRFETSIGNRRHSMSASGYSQSESSRSSQRSMRLDSHEDSEAETVMEDEGSGDATRELAKLMERRKSTRLAINSNSNRRSLYVDDPSSSSTSPRGSTDLNGFTPSSSGDGATRCICKNPESRGFMIQCESCDHYLHGPCVNIQRDTKPRVYVCVFCVQTPNMRGGRIRKSQASPLAHKSFNSFR